MSLLWDKILFGKQKLERPSNTIFDGIRLFCHIFVSLKYIMLNQNAIAWYCLIIPRDDIEETIVHLCLLNFEIDGENEKMRKIWMSYSFKRRVSDWNVLKIVVMRYYVLYKHTHNAHSTKKNGQTNFIIVSTRISNFIDTFQIQSKLFQYFFLLIFSIRHLSFTYKSSIKILSHNGIKYKLLIYWKRYTNTYVHRTVHVRTHLSIASLSLSIWFWNMRLVSWFIWTGAQNT